MFPKKTIARKMILLMLRLMRDAYGLFGNIDQSTMHCYVANNSKCILEIA
jgi:hypothetical protein